MTLYVPSTASLVMTLLEPGAIAHVFGSRSDYAGVADTGETLVTGTASRAVCLQTGPMPYGGSPQQVSIEILFSGAPGAFTIQPQTADTDVEAAYVSEGGTITTAGGSAGTTARVEIPTLKARFIRLAVVAQPANPVTAIAKITR